MSDKPREYYNIKVLLEKEGYVEVAQDDNYIWSVVDYLSCQDNDYTIFDWLRDTKVNYPEDLEGFDKKGYVSESYSDVSNMVSKINDFTDSIRAPRISMRIGVLSHNQSYYVVPIDRDDLERFKTAKEYVLICMWQN